MAKKNTTQEGTSGTSNPSNSRTARTKKVRTHALSKMTAEEASHYEGRFFLFQDSIPAKEGVIVSVKGLDENEKTIEVKFCIDKTWNDKPEVIEASQFDLIQLL